MNKDIIEVDSKVPGPALAIFAGVHGNETAGVLALQEIILDLRLNKGKVIAVQANPAALAANVRMIEKNLNRCFYKDNTGNSPEDIRARQLMKILDQCDALLDLHMFYDDDGLPFAICEDNSLELANKLDVDIISTNWAQVEPGGTDGYMFEQGKIGVCVECGPISKATEYTAFAVKTIYQYLQYFGMIDEPVNFSSTPKRIIRANNAVIKSSDEFILQPNLHNFERLRENQLIAQDDITSYTALKGECIIFPHYNARIGEESYIIGREII